MKSQRIYHYKFILIFTLIGLILTSVLLIGHSNQRVYAVGEDTGIHTFTGAEVLTHQSATSGSSFSERVEIDTGIQIYGLRNNGMGTSGNHINLDTNSLYIDFSNAKPLYYAPANQKLIMNSDSNYSFMIFTESGKKVWYAHYTGSYAKNENDETTYYLSLDVNGVKRVITSQEPSSLKFNPAVFGKNSLTLTDGLYKIQIKRYYAWATFGLDAASYNTSSLTEGSILVDCIDPVLSVKKADGNSIENGSYTNQKVIFSAEDLNFLHLYYKKPNGSSYSYITANTYTTESDNGWYYVYAVDAVGNQTDIVSVYYDDIKPTGILSSGGTTISSGSYINESFSFSSVDQGSGIEKIFYKTPVSEDYQPYLAGTIIPKNSENGWYSFYAVDKAGNISDISSVYLESKESVVEIYQNGTLAYRQTMTASGTFDTDIFLKPNDTIRISYHSSSGKVTCNYPLESDIVIGTDYPESSYMISLTSATGIQSNFIYHIVRNKPAIAIDGIQYEDGATIYFKEDTLINWFCDSTITNTKDTGMSIYSEGNHQSEIFISYNQGKSKTLTTKAGTQTKYMLSLNDRAGNESHFTIYIDKIAPIGTWISNNQQLENNGYTRFPLRFELKEENVTATYSKNNEEFKPYEGQTFTEDGTYTIVLTDLAGNKNSFVAHIDTVKPIGQLYADYEKTENGSITNGKIYFSWDEECTATVNGIPYIKNTVLTADGVYHFILTDIAGNQNEYEIEIDTQKPTFNQDQLDNDQTYIVSKWYAVERNGHKKLFATYESALQYACDLEFENNVIERYLEDINDFTQYHLIASKGNPIDDIRTGNYWQYKSQANENNSLYYFDRQYLQEVITYYAQRYVSEVCYGTDTDCDEYAENMYDNLWIADGKKIPCANHFLFTATDCEKIYAELIGGKEGKVPVKFGIPFQDQFEITGIYEITEIDQAGNSSTYLVFLDQTSPELHTLVEIYGEDEKRELTITKDNATSFYYKSFEILTIIDQDQWAMVTIENNGKTSYYIAEDNLPVLNKSGEYQISVYDRLNNGYSFTVYIVGEELDITFQSNADNTAFEIDIALKQSFNTLVMLEIYKDGEKLEGISTNQLHYTFDKDGVYTVVLRDNFGRTIEKSFDFDKSLPNGTLSGVENNGRTNTDVNFTFDNQRYDAMVLKNGELLFTDQSGTIVIQEDGQYEIHLINKEDEENIRIYCFELDKQAPIIQLEGCENGKTTNHDVTISWTDPDVKWATYSLDGTVLPMENGMVFSQEGSYVITLTDDLGNQSKVQFTIDKTLDFTILINQEESNDITITNQDVIIQNNEPLLITISKDNESYAYEFGQTLNQDGHYEVKIFDSFGNVTTFKFTIDKMVEADISTGNGVISNDDVSITVNETVSIDVKKDGVTIHYTIGDVLTEEGFYEVTIGDLYGNEKKFTFQIVKGMKTNLDYSLDETIEIISITKDGEIIAIDTHRLHFTEDGIYTIVCQSEGKEYTFTLGLDTTAPTIDLNGIEDGETANVTVIIDGLSEEGIVEVYRNGEKIDYQLGDEIKEYGSYEIKVTDMFGNARTYTFTLKYQLNGGAIALIVIGVVTVMVGTILVILKKRRVFKK